MVDVFVFVGSASSSAVKSLTTDHPYALGEEGVAVANDCGNVEVISEVLAYHDEFRPFGVEVCDNRFVFPILVHVDDVPPVMRRRFFQSIRPSFISNLAHLPILAKKKGDRPESAALNLCA